MPDDARLTADGLKSLLGLVPLGPEGGFFVETWRATETIAAAALPARYGGARSLGTAIYYLLEAGTCSRMHRITSDEVFHFYLGDPVEMLLLVEGEPGRIMPLGPDVEHGMRPQIVVPAGVWQGARLVEGGSVALMGTTVAPGFDFADFEHGERGALVAVWPDQRSRIEALTP